MKLKLGLTNRFTGYWWAYLYAMELLFK